MFFIINDTPRFRVFLWAAVLLFYTVPGKAQLTVDFTADKTGGCKPLIVSFSNKTTGASVNAVYHWDFRNGNSSAMLNPGAIFEDERVYDVTLTVKDGATSASVTRQVTVYAPPVVDFTASVVKGCVPLQVAFTAIADGGKGGISNYTWDYGDGNIDQSDNVIQSHSYTVAQKASVSLTVSNSYGCISTFTKQNLVNVLPPLLPAFGASQNILCRITDPVQFENKSAGPGTLTSLWDFGDGTNSTLANPSHLFNEKGTYTLTLTVSSSEGCTAATTKDGYINVADFSSEFTMPGLICRGSVASFTSTSTPLASNHVWVVDGAAAPDFNANSFDYTFTSGGSHTILLRNTFGNCPDSVSKSIIINDIPDLRSFIAATDDSCGAPLSYQFEDTTAGAVKWEWDFTHTFGFTVQSTIRTPSFSYLTDGGYEVWLKVTNAAGCIGTATKYLSINRPYVYITAEGEPAPCAGFSKTFIANSADSITRYNWNFGDGTSSTLPRPSHLFSTQGTYGVTLSYTSVLGCTGTVSYGNVEVYAKPVASFTASATTVCGNAPVTFTAVNQGLGFYYSWYFGDNQSDYGFNTSTFTHQYTSDSIYTVTLVVTTLGYCSDTITRTNLVKVLPPFPRITSAINTCTGNRGMVILTQDSKKAVSLLWDFGDGTAQSYNVDSPSVSHKYAATGSYKVVLTATNGQCSVRDSTMVYVLLKQQPLLAASASAVCGDAPIQVTINNLQINPWPDSYNRYYHLYRTEYNDLTAFEGFINNNQNYEWGNSYTGSFSVFENGKTGLRTILRSTGFDCEDTTNFIPLSIKAASAGLEVVNDATCFKSPVILRDDFRSNSRITSWKWDFGDGSTATYDHGGIVSHIYANPGEYTVRLTIADTSGCTSTSNEQAGLVSVNGPKAGFSASSNNTFITLPVTFNNTTNNYNSLNSQYTWTFGQGAASTEFSPTRSYAQPGEYTVTLVAVNGDSTCADTATQVVSVANFNPAFSIKRSSLASNHCLPVMVKLTNNSINYTSIKWDFGDGNTAENLDNPAHIYDKPGTYVITLLVYGPGGLTGTWMDSITIKSPVATLYIDKKLGCAGLVSIITAHTKDAGTYTWDLGDGTLLPNMDSMVTHGYNDPGVYRPRLMLTDSGGCSAFFAAADSVIVRSNPVAAIVPADPVICAEQSVVLTASGGSTFVWSPANGLSNIQVAAPAANPNTSVSYTVTVKDDIGCADSARVQVTVIQKNIVRLIADTSVCLGGSLQLAASGAGIYSWISQTNGLSDINIPNPVATPLINTVYTVTGSDAQHCFSDTAEVAVSVRALPVVSIPPIPGALPGNPVQLTGNYSPDVTSWLWSPADYLSCSACPSPVSRPLASISYKVMVVNRDGCTASATVALKLPCAANTVFIPAAFSPNDDGINDVFSIKGIAVVKHLIIYNRWGKPVYERNNYIAADRSNGWDGRYNGEALPAGAYTFFAEMQCQAGGTFARKGTVMLVR